MNRSDFVSERLKRSSSTYSVRGSLPVVAFGDFESAKVATVGLNPSAQEYLDRNGSELVGSARRFETLGSLGAQNRAALTDDQCEQALVTMKAYFQPGKPVYSWFAPLTRVLAGFGVDYASRGATHLDLVQEATSPKWTELLRSDPQAVANLLASDLPFLNEQIRSFGYETVLCNGRTALDHVARLLEARMTSTVRFGALGKVVVSRGETVLGGKRVRVAGWNLPLARAGLTISELSELGQLLRSD